MSFFYHCKKVDLFQPFFFEGLLKFVQIKTKYNMRVTITRLTEKLQNKSTYNSWNKCWKKMVGDYY